MGILRAHTGAIGCIGLNSYGYTYYIGYLIDNPEVYMCCKVTRAVVLVNAQWRTPGGGGGGVVRQDQERLVGEERVPAARPP